MLDPLLGFLNALSVNLSIGLLALLVGLCLGFVTAAVRLAPNRLGAQAMNFFIGILRAVPSYVIMVVVAAILTSADALGMLGSQAAALIALFLALLAGTVSSSSDACLTFLQYRAQGRMEQACLIVPNAFQIFIVAVMSSGVGAAIGVHEAVHYTLALAETYDSREDRIVLVLVVILFFAVILACTKYVVARASARLLAQRAH
jgi:ABC-type amino acid transport system permease subunit